MTVYPYLTCNYPKRKSLRPSKVFEINYYDIFLKQNSPWAIIGGGVSDIDMKNTDLSNMLLVSLKEKIHQVHNSS